MRRVAFVMLCSCLLASLVTPVSPAKAGDYGARYVWYSSNRCYQKVVRHETTVRYVPVGAYRSHYGYYERPYVYGRPHERYRVVRFSAFDYYSNFGAPRCQWQEAPLRDGPGRWVWGVKQICY